MSPEKSAPGAPESEEDVVQIQSALREDILTLFPNGHQGAGVVVKTPARRRSLSLSLSLSLIARLSVFSRARLKSGEEEYSRERGRDD